MTQVAEPVLSLSEWMVLSLVRDGPVHGNALVVLLERDGNLGRIWHVHKAVVYRSIDRLVAAELIRPAGEQASDRGPVRSLVEITPAGREAAVAWVHRPVRHTRDIRSELLVKLALLDRSGADPHDLLTAQHALLRPVADALAERIASAGGFDRALVLWRYETVSATIRFLDAMVLAQP